MHRCADPNCTSQPSPRTGVLAASWEYANAGVPGLSWKPVTAAGGRQAGRHSNGLGGQRGAATSTLAAQASAHGKAVALVHPDGVPQTQVSRATHVGHQARVALVANRLQRITHRLELCRRVPGEHLCIASQGLQAQGTHKWSLGSVTLWGAKQAVTASQLAVAARHVVAPTLHASCAPMREETLVLPPPIATYSKPL